VVAETLSGNWAEIDYDLPSVNEAKAAGEPDDEVDDGPVQVLIEDISPQLENAFGDKPRRALKLRVLAFDGDTQDGNVGKVFRQYMTESTHPKSNMYQYFKAAAGGNLDPSQRLRLIDLANRQIRGTITHEAVDGNPDKIKQVLGSLLPVKEDLPVAPF
jgi:hypothetical protein